MASVCRTTLVALALVAAGPLRAQEAVAVKDEAKLFKAETIRKANEAARDLAKKGIHLVIETYPTVPTGMELIEKVKEMSAKEREEVFGQWARKRVHVLGPNTIYILVTNDPKHLEVRAGPEARKKGFTDEKSAAVIKGMLEQLRKKHVDEALLDAVSTLRELFDAPAAPAEKEVRGELLKETP